MHREAASAVTSVARGIRGATVGLVVAALIGVGSPSALGATPSVNCNTGGNLQAKIDAAAPGSTVMVKGTCFGHFLINGKDLTVKGNPTATLDGNDLGRTLDVAAPGKAVHLAGLTITGGAAGSGGGIGSTAGELTLTNVRVTGNLAAQTFGSPSGGGILVTGGDVTLTGSTVSGNRVLATEHAFDPVGGGLSVTNGDLTITDSVISGNRATAVPSSGFVTATGGGFALDGGNLLVEHSTISGNRVTASAPSSSNARGGGGYQAIGFASVVRDSRILANMATAISDGHADAEGGGLLVDHLTLVRSTVDRNWAVGTSSGGNAIGEGGGIDTASGSSTTIVASTLSRNHAVSGTSAATEASAWGGGGYLSDVKITNSTIALNTVRATPGTGGSSYVDGGGLDASAGISIVNSTIAGNHASGSGTSIGHFGGGLYTSSSMTLEATIIANNTATTGPDCSSGPISKGHNLIRDVTGCFLLLKPTDKVGVDPKLGPLQGNGGPTQTMAIALTSPARNAIPKAACAVGRDQRGVHRPQPLSGKCDIGAYERKVA